MSHRTDPDAPIPIDADGRELTVERAGVDPRE